MKLRSIICAFGMVLLASSLCHAQASDPGIALPSVQAANSGSTIKIDGRIFAGIYDSQMQGAYQHPSLAIPDAKLRFTYLPSKDIAVVSRLSFASASSSAASSVGYDYLYADLKNWGGLIPGHLLRVGRMKIDYGEETWTNNPEEDNLISNSGANASGYDEGLDFQGHIVSGDIPVMYSLSLLNGTKDVVPAVSAPESIIKISTTPLKPLYISASYLNTGKLLGSSADFGVAGLTSAPTGATNWIRHAWELDARWNFGATGLQPSIPTGATVAVPFQLAAAVGKLADDVTGAANRDGNYWYLEGLYNITPRWYTAARYSDMGLNDGNTAKLVDSPVAVNRYQRTSLGLGYRLTTMTVLKAEYSINNTQGGASSPKLNQFTLGLATKF